MTAVTDEDSIQHPVGKAGDLIARTGRRLGVKASEWVSDWYVSHSPRNDNCNAEGDWAEWVALAREILRLDAERASSAEGQQTEAKA